MPRHLKSTEGSMSGSSGRARHRRLPISIYDDTVAALSPGNGPKFTEPCHGRVQLLASPAAVVKPERVPTMKRTLRPGDVDETIMEELLHLLRDLLKVLVRGDIDGIASIEKFPAHRCFAADLILVACAEGRLHVVHEQ